MHLPSARSGSGGSGSTSKTYRATPGEHRGARRRRVGQVHDLAPADVDEVRGPIHLSSRGKPLTQATPLTIIVDSVVGGKVIEKLTTLDLRQHLGDLLNRVALRHDEF